ncbi:hypothetical protein EF913_05100 [Streptomyces sp. WAC04189]|nr:hypothetical protein EF913_05100 [Streptomyces sp. WAC04189]RSS63206.1 hypothetical protein EF907_29635 [Streptomyces sp. WAC06273]
MHLPTSYGSWKGVYARLRGCRN